MLYEDLKAQKKMAEAQGNRRFLSLILEALCLKFEVSKMAQKENPSWFNSQESKEGADPENVPDTEDLLFTKLQLFFFYLLCSVLTVSLPCSLTGFSFLFLVFSLYPTAIPCYHRSIPG